MNNWKKYALGAVLVTAAGLIYVNNPHRDIPTDLRDAVIDGAALDSRFAATEKDNGTVPVPKAPVAAETGASDKGYGAGNEPSSGAPIKPVEWVTITGGKFMMGKDEGGEAFDNARPRHEVDVKTFDMAKTPVTLEQYAECVSKNQCSKPYCGSGTRVSRARCGQAGKSARCFERADFFEVLFHAGADPGFKFFGFQHLYEDGRDGFPDTTQDRVRGRGRPRCLGARSTKQA